MKEHYDMQTRMGSEKSSPIDYRYERKYLVDQLDLHQVISLIKLHPAMFSEIYPPRYVNNVYLDTPAMDNYYANAGGAAEREKTRLRWYHDLFQEIDAPILEFKIKRGMVGTKIQHHFAPLHIEEGFSHETFDEALNRSQLPLDVKSRLQTQVIVLVNRYKRWYFATPDRKFRVTVDSDMTYYNVSKLNNRFRYKHKDHRNIIVELKYGRDDDRTANRISARFPFRVTKSSKYVTGIDSVYV